jgi:ribonuclease G
MSKELVISATPHETRVAIVEDGQLCEIYIEREKEFALVGSLYKGRVTRVLPGMQSAFVDIGLDSDAFLYVSDFLENLEEYDHVVHSVEDKVQKMEQQGGEVFAPSTTDGAPPVESAPAAEAQGVEEGAAPPPSEAGAPAPASPEPPPSGSSTSPPQRSEQRQDRSRSGYGDRGWQGRRPRRWGRQGRRDNRQGRDLPTSKYASSRPPDSRRESHYEPPPADYEPVILPGESLAKYKDRIPATPAVSASESQTGSLEAQPGQQVPPVGSPAGHTAAGLPDSLYATLPSESPAEASVEQPVTSFSEAAISPPEVTIPPAEPFDAHEAEPETAAHHEMGGNLSADEGGHPHNGAALSDDEVTSLAEQLAEAKHEEAQAEAEDREDADEASAEPFMEPAELDVIGESAELEISAAGHFQDAGESVEQTEEPAAEHGAEDAVQSSEAAPSSARISDQPRARFQRPARSGGGSMRSGTRHRGGRRSGRPQDYRQHQRPQQHRRPQLISEMLKVGQEIIVQIAKEPLGKKGARITSHVALPGRYLVYMPTVDHIGVSRRIGSAEDRARLRRVVNEAKGSFPGGFIVRTAAGGASDEEIRSDVEFLGRTWDTIRGSSEQRHAPALLHRDLNLVERILRDYLNDDYTAIWIDSEEEYGKVLEFVGRFQPKLVGRVKLYTKDAPIFEEFGVQQELDKALRPKVWLKSGGYIVINHTEALVAIDVNTGKYVGRGSTRLEDTIVKTNLEAVKEIIRQIRLRDLGGIIVVDFIDMEERRNRDKVMSALEQALSQDRAPSKALSFNEFGLVAITRKRTKQALERVLCQPCPYCTGSGMVKSIPTICYEIQAEARKMAADLDSQSVTLRVNPEIAKALKTRESSLIEELEQVTRKSIIIQSDATLHWEQYDIY